MKFTDLTQEHLAELAEISPSKIVVMIYDEAIESLRDAARAAERGEIMARLDATTVTADLVSELRCGLDFENGGEVAANLDSLYSFIVGRLPMIHLNNDAKLANDLADLLVPLHASWVELDGMIEDGVIDIDSITEMPGAAHVPEELPMLAKAG
jgi:flagellar secretion chaperone FliS